MISPAVPFLLFIFNMQHLLILIIVSAVKAGHEYLIDTDKCKLPDFPAFTEETNKIYVDLPYVKCGNLDPLTYTTVEDEVAYLHIDLKNLDQYYLSEEEVDCCLSYVYRSGTLDEPDVGISVTDCQPFNSTVPLEDEIVLVKCYMGADIIYNNVHSPVVYFKSLQSKKKKNNNLRTDTQPISVLFIVIDSISRLNLIRTMPRTRNFLLENGFIEYVGYNKIDDNTYPNFNALITGLNRSRSDEKCKPNQVGGLDKCPMIWYDFQKHGYVTAYAEDWATLATYNYIKKGFQNPPTDFYFKPFLEAAETLDKDVLDTMPHCAGPLTEAERILNLAEDFSKTFKDIPNFGIFWMNTFSHNKINSPTRMDVKVRTFFENLEDNGIFNTSIVFLLSDHGIRFGPIRKTIQGWYEERLPTNLISIPPWFQKQYPKKYENVQKNANKLTSTYDVYMTLQEILHLSTKSYNISSSDACPTCTSLFSHIPNNRSCKQAGVPELWCTCIGRLEENSTVITEDLKNEAIKMVQKEINRHQTFEQYVTNVVLSSINASNVRKTYLFMIFETNMFYSYQAFFRISGNPVKLDKLIKIIRLF